MVVGLARDAKAVAFTKKNGGSSEVYANAFYEIGEMGFDRAHPVLTESRRIRASVLPGALTCPLHCP